MRVLGLIVVLSLLSGDRNDGFVRELLVISLPVAIEAGNPLARRRKSNGVIVMGICRKIKGYNYAVTRAALLPAVKYQYLFLIIYPKQLDMLPGKSR